MGHKYLLEIHHGIGDIVQYTGLIRSVREHEKDAFIGLVLNKSAYKSLINLDDNINYIHIVDFGGGKIDLIRSIHEIRKQKYDYMVCSIHSRQKSMEFMAAAFGAKKVVGTLLNHLSKMNRKYVLAKVNRADHVVKQNFDVLTTLSPDFKLFEPYLVCPPAPYKLDKPSLGLCIGTSIPQKTWSIENYVTVGEYFEKQGYHIVLLGGKKEAEQFEASGLVKDNWMNLLGKTNLVESASECAQCELIIGGDTGLMHMAAAVGTKTLTLFSCSEPTTHAPYSEQSYYYYVPTQCQFCFGSEKMKNCKEYKCLNAIDTSRTIEIAENILKNDLSKEKYKLEKQKEELDV